MNDVKIQPEEFKFFDGICSECLGRSFLPSIEVNVGNCTICNRLQLFTQRLYKITRAVYGVLNTHYEFQTQNPQGFERQLQKDGLWERPGDSVEDILLMLGFSERVAPIIHDTLYEQFDVFFSGEELLFDEEAHYTKATINDSDIQNEWAEVEKALIDGNRFFNKRAQKFFDKLLKNYETVLDVDRQDVALRAGPFRQLKGLWRARVFYENDDIKKAMIDPARYLGPPPSKFASAGRMNAEHVPVFYGATEKEIALAEVRPPVGSRVVLAKFKFSSNVNLFDLNLVKELPRDYDPFNDKDFERFRYAMFFRKLGQRLSRPVLPGNERSDYIMTQAICDYIAQYRSGWYNGIVFDSSQCNMDGRNVVLFNRDLLVRPALPIVDENTDADLDSFDGENDYPDYRANVECLKSTSRYSFSTEDIFSLLEVDDDSLEVHHIDTVSVNSTAHSVKRKITFKPKP